MFALTRTVRFSVNSGPEGPVASPNAFAGRPSMCAIGRHFELVVRCRGELDPVAGYLLDIKDIDRATREGCIGRITDACSIPGASPGPVLASCLGPMNTLLRGRLDSLRWRLSPFYSLEISMSDPKTVLLRQRFDLAASHRLHVPTLSDEENARLFGKCNRPNGHGHNYQYEPSVAVPLGSDFSLQDLEPLCARVLTERFDHTHLNLDAPEFGPNGLNPSVENIARVFFDLLREALHTSGKHCSLRSMTVWETDRTSATYPA